MAEPRPAIRVAAHHLLVLVVVRRNDSADVVLSSLELPALRLYYNASRNFITSAFISIAAVVEEATNSVMPITATYSESVPSR